MTPTTLELMDHQRETEDGHTDFSPPDATPAEIETRHSCWNTRRAKFRNAIESTDNCARRLQRWDNCGACAVIEESKSTGKIRITCWHCHDRLCMPCQRRRSQALKDAIDYNAQGGRLRFVTLTEKHVPEPLKNQLKDLREDFAKLRRSKLWKENVRGGISSVEVKLGDDGLWHVHLHLILEGNYIDQEELSTAWFNATGDSHIVDIREVTNLDKASHYITKYITKPVDTGTLNNSEALSEFAEAIKGTRTYALLGKWKKPPPRPDADDPGDWEPVATVADWHRAKQLELPWALILEERLSHAKWIETNASESPPIPHFE